MDNENDSEVEEIEKWLDDALKSGNIDDVIHCSETANLDLTHDTDSALQEQLSVESYVNDLASAFSKFIKEFEDFNLKDNNVKLSDDLNKVTAKNSYQSHLLYKEQLEKALKKENISMDTFIQVMNNLENINSEIIDEKDDAIDYTEFNLDQDDLERVSNLQNTQKDSTNTFCESYSELGDIRAKNRDEFSMLLKSFNKEIESENSKFSWQREIEEYLANENERDKGLEESDRISFEKAKVTLDEMRNKALIRVEELTLSIEAERKNLEKLREMAKVSRAQLEETAAIKIQSVFRRYKSSI